MIGRPFQMWCLGFQCAVLVVNLIERDVVGVLWALIFGSLALVFYLVGDA